MAPDTRPLVSFDNFVNSRRNDSTAGLGTMGRYIGKVMLGSFSKMLIIVSNLYNSVIYSVCVLAVFTCHHMSGHKWSRGPFMCDIIGPAGPLMPKHK